MHAPPAPMPFGFQGPESAPYVEAPLGERTIHYGSSQAWCVRTCDGRHFPVSTSDGQGGVASCNNLCPASETRVVYGSDIDDAATENGMLYSDMQNAFRYRDEIVAGCTCNGKEQVGLAQIKIENDPTLRRGDIVVGPGGLMAGNVGAGRRGAALNYSRVPRSVRSRYRHVPIVAAE